MRQQTVSPSRSSSKLDSKAILIVICTQKNLVQFVATKLDRSLGNCVYSMVLLNYKHYGGQRGGCFSPFCPSHSPLSRHIHHLHCCNCTINTIGIPWTCCLAPPGFSDPLHPHITWTQHTHAHAHAFTYTYTHTTACSYRDLYLCIVPLYDNYT